MRLKSCTRSILCGPKRWHDRNFWGLGVFLIQSFMIQQYCLLSQSQQSGYQIEGLLHHTPLQKMDMLFCYTLASKGMFMPVIWHHPAAASSASDKSVLVPLKLMSYRFLHSSFSTDRALTALQRQWESCLINDFFVNAWVDGTVNAAASSICFHSRRNQR